MPTVRTSYELKLSKPELLALIKDRYGLMFDNKDGYFVVNSWWDNQTPHKPEDEKITFIWCKDTKVRL